VLDVFVYYTFILIGF
jgi:uncharacterized protein YerC